MPGDYGHRYPPQCGRTAMWVERIRRGDREAERELLAYFSVYERVRLFVRHKAKLGFDDQSDLIQEVLLVILDHLRNGKYDPAQGTLGAYVHGVTRRKVLSHFTRLRRRPHPVNHADIVLFAESEMDSREQSRYMRTIVRSLEPRYQKVLLLRFYQDLSVREIAEQMNVTERKVYNLINYALERVRSKYAY